MTLQPDQLLRRVAAALTSVVEPKSGEDVISSGRVRDLRAGDDGSIRFRFALRPDDPGALVRETRSAAEAVEGVTAVKIDVGLPAAGGGEKPAKAAPAGESPLRPGNVPAPKPNPNLLPDIRHIIAVSSGKGGVGKSTVAANLAVAFAQDGLAVGLLDADVYGPNIPRIFGETRRPQVTGDQGREMIAPLESHGVQLMSLGFLLEDAQPAIMRGPLISGVLRQFLEQVEWGKLDLLVVDMPPGTGDAQLSLVQTVELDGAVLVTTPQELAAGDVRRAIRMFERVGTKVLGVVENMTCFTCPCCGTVYDLFGSGAGERLAEEMNIALLGSVPLDPAVGKGGDEGTPIMIAAPASAAATAFREIAGSLRDSIVGAAAAMSSPGP